MWQDLDLGFNQTQSSGRGGHANPKGLLRCQRRPGGTQSTWQGLNMVEMDVPAFSE